MPILFLLLGVAFPRLSIVLLWLFTNWFTGVFSKTFYLVIGILFLPVSALWFSVVANVFGGRWTLLTILGMGVALLIDLSSGSLMGRRRG